MEGVPGQGMGRSMEEMMQDENVALDADLRATLISALLNCNPKRYPSLPPFRIEELMTSCLAIDSRRTNDQQVVDSLLSLYTLTSYYGLSTHYDTTATLSVVAHFYTMMLESITVDLALGAKMFVMSDLCTVFQRRVDLDPSCKLEIFQQSLELCRSVLRDTSTLARDLKQQRRLRDEMTIPKNPDCVKPTSIYFMICFAVCHMSLVLHSQSRLSIIPGVLEALLVMILSKPAKALEPVDSASPSLAPSHLVGKALELAVFTAHCVFTPRTLQEVILVRSRVGRHLRPAEIEYILYRVSAFKAFASAPAAAAAAAQQQQQQQQQHRQQRSVCKMTVAQVGSKLDFRVPDFHFLSGSRGVMDLVAMPAKGKASSRDDSDDDAESSDRLQPDAPAAKVDPRAARVAHVFSTLRRGYRLPFLVLQSACLPAAALEQVFEAHYQPERFHFPAPDLCTAAYSLPSLPASKASVALEGALFRFTREHRAPRFLNPKEELYWITLYFCEMLYKQTNEGAGFCPPVDHERQYIERRLRVFDSARRSVPSRGKGGATDLSSALRRVREEAMLEHRLLELEQPAGSGQPLPAAKATEEEDELAAILRENVRVDVRRQSEWLAAVYSAVWYCAPKKSTKAQRLVTVGVESYSDNPLDNMPTRAAAIEYARMLEAQRAEKTQEEALLRQKLEDQQHELVAKNRTRRAAALRATKERVKEQIESKNAFKVIWAGEKARAAAEAEQRAARLARDQAEAQALEVLRIRDIKSTKAAQEAQAAEEHMLQLEMEKTFISKIASDQETREIVRRIKEEERMRYLEERRRVLDARTEQHRQAARDAEAQAQAQFMEAASRAQARLRKGNFVWHNGKLGFYDQVRREVKEYVQFEDASGRPYYYDPIYGTYQYRPPRDADVHHHTDDDRRAYDAVHGEGAYDAHRADIEFKNGVNQHGGYYDEHGQWVVTNGYYDESYNWVEYEGYVDDRGKFVRFAKVSGDLNFMV